MTVDMSPETVTARLRCVSDLRRLCLALAPRQPAGVHETAAPYGAPSPADVPGRPAIRNLTSKGAHCTP